MNPTITKMLDEEYERTLQAVAQAQAGSDEAQWQLKKLGELHRQRLDERKQNDEAYVQMEELTLKQAELQLKNEQAKESKKDRIIRIVLDGAAILVPVTVSSYWMAKGLKFEENGTFTSRTGQWLSNHLRLFRK
ncbi:MAG: hypothetical protein IKN04_02210 [Clostridia bacterium]|nr:hypothetical protein [Clostridia bacterium]MBR6185624.1 hypothetical protein [Clostridia bacterium]